MTRVVEAHRDLVRDAWESVDLERRERSCLGGCEKMPARFLRAEQLEKSFRKVSDGKYLCVFPNGIEIELGLSKRSRCDQTRDMIDCGSIVVSRLGASATTSAAEGVVHRRHFISCCGVER